MINLTIPAKAKEHTKLYILHHRVAAVNGSHLSNSQKYVQNDICAPFYTPLFFPPLSQLIIHLLRCCLQFGLSFQNRRIEKQLDSEFYTQYVQI